MSLLHTGLYLVSLGLLAPTVLVDVVTIAPGWAALLAVGNSLLVLQTNDL